VKSTKYSVNGGTTEEATGGNARNDALCIVVVRRAGRMSLTSVTQ